MSSQQAQAADHVLRAVVSGFIVTETSPQVPMSNILGEYSGFQLRRKVEQPPKARSRMCVKQCSPPYRPLI